MSDLFLWEDIIKEDADEAEDEEYEEDMRVTLFLSSRIFHADPWSH